MKKRNILNSNLQLLRILEKNQDLTIDDVLVQEKKSKSHLPFAHGTDHDGKISSNSHLDYLSLINKYASVE